jgi:hypothetical protein
MSKRQGTLGMLISLVVVGLVLVTTSGCDSAGAGGGGGEVWDYVSPSLVSASIAGGAESGSINVSRLSPASSDMDTFYQDAWYEYAEFIVVPEIAYNYNGRFARGSGMMQELAPILSDTTFSRYSWAESNVLGMYRMLEAEEGDRRLHMNETGTHYMYISNDSDATEWLEVEETSAYKRSIWLQEFAYDSIDMIEIVEFDDYVFTKSIRFHGRFEDDGSEKDSFPVQVFGGIHRTDDPEQQILGVMKRCLVNTTTSPWTITETVSDRAVAAFDLSHLMIRPTVAELSSTPFQFPYEQFSTYELAGSDGSEHWSAYNETQDGSGDPVGPQAGETFAASEFVTPTSVLDFLNSGVTPIDVVTINILGIELDQIGSSGILDLPDWQRSDVTVNMGP